MIYIELVAAVVTLAWALSSVAALAANIKNRNRPFKKVPKGGLGTRILILISEVSLWVFLLAGMSSLRGGLHHQGLVNALITFSLFRGAYEAINAFSHTRLHQEILYYRLIKAPISDLDTGSQMAVKLSINIFSLLFSLFILILVIYVFLNH